MKKVNMKYAIEKYNHIMAVTGYDHNQIGTWFSESTDGWNLRDMVAECDYLLSTYYEYGYANCDMMEDDRKVWLSETGMLRRFIKRYEPFVKNMNCVIAHCSKYD